MADCSYNVQQAYGSIQAGQMCGTQSYLYIWVVSSRTKMYVTQSVFFTFELFQAGHRCYLKPGVFSRADDGEASRGETEENIESRAENIKM